MPAKKTPATPTKKPDISPPAETAAQPSASPMEALSFLDGLLAKMGGSRSDHVAIQGAIGILAKAIG